MAATYSYSQTHLIDNHSLPPDASGERNRIKERRLDSRRRDRSRLLKSLPLRAGVAANGVATEAAQATGPMLAAAAGIEFKALTGGDMPATLAHEIRGPLMALATSAEMLVEDADHLDRTQIRTMARSIHTRALWLQGLVENLLCATALRTGHFRVHRQCLDPLELIAEVRLLLEPLLLQRRQPLRLRRPRGVTPPLLADARRLSQVLVNLVSNASKFAPEGTPIEVALIATGGRLRISVADRGPGLPPGGAKALFEPYQRAAADDGKVDGVGLGLAIARAIVTAHGGKIGALNRRGGGAVFWIELAALPAAVVLSRKLQTEELEGTDESAGR